MNITNIGIFIYDWIYVIFCIIIILFCLKIYSESDVYNLKCIIASKDGNRYCVREREKIDDAVNLLATISDKCQTFVNMLKEKYPNRKDIDTLYKNYSKTILSETLPTSELTAYTENKGEKVALCLNKKKNGTKLIDEHTLMFVALHELTHIMTESIGHKQQFWDNFKFILVNAKEMGIHDPENYKETPQEYCSQIINSNPYFDV